MKNLLTAAQMRQADAYTISHKSITSLALMEMAARAFVVAFKREISNPDTSISIYAGTGNNGGDGLAIARLLKESGYDNIRICIVRFQKSESPDFLSNLQRLNLSSIPLKEIRKISDFPIERAEVIIDAILGTGLNKGISGDIRALVEYLNGLQTRVVAVDIPTGFPSEGPLDVNNCVLKADITISFQRPKINFFFPESVAATTRWKAVDIGLDEEFIQTVPGNWKLVEEADIQNILKPRSNFSHKGTYGHALIIAGDTMTMGAALLCTDACVHSGAGLTTASVPESGLSALNSFCPEAMFIPRTKLINEQLSETYQAIGIGPGLGTNEEALGILKSVCAVNTALVLDADALTILASNPDLLNSLPANSILTPHVKEFDRLFGKSANWWDRLNLALSKARELQIVIIVKNQYTFIVLPDGKILINPTGNPTMAVGGMGDVLTGIITAFLAQGYPAADAAMIGTYIHGKAGDDLALMNSIPPRYIVSRLPTLIRSMRII